MKKRIVVIVFICLFFGGTIFAKTNNYVEVETLNIDEIGEAGLFDKVLDTTGDLAQDIASIILQWVTKCIYAVARMVERLIANFSVVIFGVQAFPWEDYIVFNALPYLDVNFFNASSGGLFSATLGGIIRTIYFSLLTLSLTILGIGVAIVAIRLAVSSIASEKAKYKEAVSRCLYTVIMLFSVHILMSFCFYLNESICEGASAMLNSLITAEDIQAIVDAVNSADEDEYLDFVRKNTTKIQDYISTKITDQAIYNFKYGMPDLTPNSGTADLLKSGLFNAFKFLYTDLINSDPRAEKIADYLTDNSHYLNDRLDGLTYVKKGGTLSESFRDPLESSDSIERVRIDVWNITHSATLEVFQASYTADEKKSDWYEIIEEVYKCYILGEIEDGGASLVISSLAENFKEAASEFGQYDNPPDAAYIGVYLYAIMLVQSIMLLITYLKRLFYVTILAILAPIVIIYDFFMGDSNKVFTTWFKELCSLIFVQSMQALLMTVMLALVVKIYASYVDNVNVAQTLGIYVIIIMVLIPKVELLVKRIFGLGSGVMDDSMTGGKNSLAKGMMALRLGGRLLDNGAKVVGGVAKAGAGIGSAAFGSVKKKGQIAENNRKALEAEGLTGGSKNGSLNGGSNASRPLTQAGLMDAIRSAGQEDPEEAAQRAKHENAQAIRGGLKQAASGLVETAGAIGGASLGAVYSMGTGGDDFVTNMVTGAGIGDAVGEGVTNATLGTANRLVDWNYERKQLNKKRDKSEERLKTANEYKKTVGQARKVEQPTGTKSAKRTIQRQELSTTQKANNEVVKKMNNLKDQHATNAKIAEVLGDKEGQKKYQKEMAKVSKAAKEFQNQTKIKHTGSRDTKETIKKVSEKNEQKRAKRSINSSTVAKKNLNQVNENSKKVSNSALNVEQVSAKNRESKLNASDIAKMSEMKKNSAMKKNLENSGGQDNKKV